MTNSLNEANKKLDQRKKFIITNQNQSLDQNHDKNDQVVNQDFSTILMKITDTKMIGNAVCYTGKIIRNYTKNPEFEENEEINILYSKLLEISPNFDNLYLIFDPICLNNLSLAEIKNDGTNPITKLEKNIICTYLDAFKGTPYILKVPDS